MSDQQSAQDVIEKYQKRQKRAPGAFIIGAIAIILIFAGIVIIYQWYANPDSPLFAAFQPTATQTPTATNTEVPPTATNTPVPPTATPTETQTPTITLTPTIAGAFIYTVQEGDTLFSISEQFNVPVIRIMEANELEDENIFISQQLLIPDPNEEGPTATPIPANLPRGTLVEYRIQPNDTLSYIAFLFNSTVEAILEANEGLDNENEIFVGQIIQVPVNLVTPAPTNTPGSASNPGEIATLTPSPSPTP